MYVYEYIIENRNKLKIWGKLLKELNIKWGVTIKWGLSEYNKIYIYLFFFYYSINKWVIN